MTANPHEQDIHRSSDLSTEKEIPRLSPSVAKVLIGRSPAHARQAHRLLGGGNDSDPTKAMDTGKILEALVFGAGMSEFVMLDFPDYRTKDAQSARDAARDAGKTPVLNQEVEGFIAASIIYKRQLAEQGIVFDHGEYQKSVLWTCPVIGASCKGILDYFQDGIIWDFKTTTDASPRKFVRHFVDMGYDIQDAAYRDGIESTVPELRGRVKTLFAVAEVDPPYLVHIYEPSGMMRELGDRKWFEAKRQWSNCLESDFWPGYFTGIAQLEPMPWQRDFETEIETKRDGE